MQFNKDCERNKARNQASGVQCCLSMARKNLSIAKRTMPNRHFKRGRDTPYLKIRDSGKSDQVLGFPGPMKPLGRDMRDLDAGARVPKSLIF
jgi:hypothetical protein